MNDQNILTLDERGLKNIPVVTNFFIIVIFLQACKGVGSPSPRENIIINPGGSPTVVDDTPDGNPDESPTVVDDTPDGNPDRSPAGVDDTPDGNPEEPPTVVDDTPDGNPDRSPAGVDDTPDGNPDRSPAGVDDTPDGNPDRSPTVVDDTPDGNPDRSPAGVDDTPDGNPDRSPAVVDDTPDGNPEEPPTVVDDTPDGNPDDAEDNINDPDDGGLPPDDRSTLSLSILYIQASSQAQESLLLEPPPKTLWQQQWEAIKDVEKVVFCKIAIMILNDVPGIHQDNMEAVALAVRTRTINNPNSLLQIAIEGGDDIIASPNNSFFDLLSSIDRIPDQSAKEELISLLKDDIAGDIILVSAGNTGKELDRSVLKKEWVREVLGEEDVNVFFVIGTITNKDGETSIDYTSSTLPPVLADHVIAASISVPILVDGIVQIPGGTSTSAVLAGTFFARLQVLLPDATPNELVEIGKWLLEPLDNSNSLGVISFEKFTQINNYFCKPLASISLEEILWYIQSNPKEDSTLNGEGLSGDQESSPEPTDYDVSYVPEVDILVPYGPDVDTSSIDLL